MGRYGFPTKNQTHIAILLVGMLLLDCCFLAFVSDDSATLYSLAADQHTAYKLTPEGGVSVWSLIWSPSGSTERSINHSHLADSIDFGVLNIPGGPCIILCGWNYTDG